MAKGQMLVETGLDGSVWNFPAGNRNPGLNRDGPDGFLTGFRGGRRPTYRGGSGGAEPPQLMSKRLCLIPPGTPPGRMSTSVSDDKSGSRAFESNHVVIMLGPLLDHVGDRC